MVSHPPLNSSIVMAYAMPGTVAGVSSMNKTNKIPSYAILSHVYEN